MLFKILKLVGLDIPAKIEALKASLELRVEQATDHVKEVAQAAAVILALSAFAALTGAMAFGVGLIALYRWTADAYGPYAGLGAVGGILVVATFALVAAAALKGKSLAPSGPRLSRHAAGTAGVTSDLGPILGASDAAAGAGVAEAHSGAHPAPPSLAATQTAPAVSADDIVEPLAFILSKVVKYPTLGNPLADELIGNLRTTAREATGEAIERAADVIRHGDRANLVLILTSAALAGWLLSHHSRQ
jgi:hypothetical protein